MWLWIFRDSLGQISRDSKHYDAIGRWYADPSMKAPLFSWQGWWRWVDRGWESLVGLLYRCFGPHLILPMLLNAVLAGCAALLVYRLSRRLFDVGRVPLWAACLFALSPSVVYYTSLPLKESLTVTSLLLVVFGTTELFSRGCLWHVLTVLGGLFLLTILRLHLLYLALGCLAVCVACVSLASGRKALLQVTLASAGIAVLAILTFRWVDPAPEHHFYFKYFSVAALNEEREKMNHGRSQLFPDGRSPRYGWNLADNAAKATRGLVLFVLGVDPTRVPRGRQWAALPEMLVIVYLFPSLISGVRQGWRTHRQQFLPYLLFFAGLVATYGLSATNLGAMFRWRVQLLPLYYAVAVYGVFFRPGNLLHRFLQQKHDEPVRTSS